MFAMILKKYSSSPWVVSVVFGTIAMMFGSLFIYLTPPMWGVDETEHFPRAYQIAEGNFKEDALEKGYGGLVPKPIAELYSYTKYDLTDDESPVRDVSDGEKYEILKRQALDGERVPLDFIGAGIYSPVAYAAPSVGIVIGKLFDNTIGTAIFSARLASLILYVILVGVALYILRDTQIKWLVFVVGLMATTVAQASVVTVDAIAIALSLLFFAQLMTLIIKHEKITILNLALLTATAIILTLTKPNYFLLTLAIYAIPFHKLMKYQKIYAYIAYPLIVLIPALVWNLQIRDLVALSGEIQRGATINIDFLGQLTYILTHPFHFLYSLVSSALIKDWLMSSMSTINFNFVRLPSVVLVSTSGLLILTALAAATGHRLEKWSAITMLVLGTATFAGIATALYLMFTEVGARTIEGVQGRYFIPVLPFVAYAVASLLPLKLMIRGYVLGSICVAVSIAALSTSALWYVMMTY